MKTFLVVAIMRYDKNQRAITVPYLFMDYYKADTFGLASMEFHNHFSVLNHPLAIINTTLLLESQKRDLEASMSFIYGNMTHKSNAKHEL